MNQQLSSLPAEQQDDAVNILLDAINNSGTEPSTNADANANRDASAVNTAALAQDADHKEQQTITGCEKGGMGWPEKNALQTTDRRSGGAGVTKCRRCDI